MVVRFRETGDPVFKSISALSRGIQKSNNNRDTMHFNVNASNTEILFRTIHSSNQLSVYGAVSSWCEEFGQRPDETEPTSERFVAKEHEQPLKNVKPQEGMMIQHLETVCENVFRTSEHWRTASKLLKLRRCVILGKSLHWNVLQDHCRRR